MKKILLLATLVLGMVSCMKDQSLDANLVGDGNFVLSVALPDDATRAAGTDSAKGAVDNGVLNEYNVRYTLEVYDATGALAKEAQHTVTTGDKTKTSFELRLIPGRHYRFVVWADFVKEGVDPYYNVANLREVSITGTHNAMNESRDAYTAVFNTAEDGDKEVFSSASTIKMTLKRPFAKLRVVTNDMKEIDSYSTLQSATVAYTTRIYTTFNALTKVAGTPVSGVTKRVDFTDPAYQYAGEPTTEGEQTLFADYIFGTETGTVQFTLDVADDVAALPQVVFNTSIPVERNYLTTIYGPVLTDFNKVSVEIDEAFANEGNWEDAPFYQVAVTNGLECAKAILAGQEFIALNHIVVTAEDIAKAQTRSAAAINPVCNLNGFTITFVNDSDEPLFVLPAGSSFTITDGADNAGEFVLTGEGAGAAIVAEEGATLNINGGTIKNEGNADFVFEANGETNIAGGNLEEGALQNNGEVNITDGNIAGGAIENNGTTNITGDDAVVEDDAIENGENAIVGTYVYTAQELQEAINAAEAGLNNEVSFGANIAGDATILQKDGVNLIINGRGFEFDGVITVNGGGRANGNETLTFKAINFATEGSDFTFISAPSKINNAYNYSHNVTIENCTFEGNQTVGSASFTGTYNFVMKNCVATNMHSILQLQSVDNKALVEGVETVDCKNGISFGNTANPTLKNSVIKAKEYGVRGDGDASRGNLVIENTSIDANIPVIIRKVTSNGYNVTLNGNTIKKGGYYDVVFTNGKDDEEYVAPTGTYTVTGAENYMVFPREQVVTDQDELIVALNQNANVIFANDIKIEPASQSNAYGATGLNVKKGNSIYGNGYTLNIKGAGGTWDSGICTTGGLIKDLKVTGSFRGIFVKGGDHTEKVVLENVTLEGVTYTISVDQADDQGIEATNCTFNGWTSYAKTIGEVKFTNCSFGEGSGYKFCRPYAPTTFVGCNFCEGYAIDARDVVKFENCTFNGVAVTAENLATLVTGNIQNAKIPSTVSTADELIAALEDGRDVVFANDIKIEPASMSNAYGATGINVKYGQTIDGNGHTLNIKGAGGTWDSGINTTGGVIKNLTVTGSFRGIFINHTSEHYEKVVLENVTIGGNGTVYTISCDQGLYQGIEATNCTFNGWTSFAKTAGEAKFVNCNFGEGSTYKYCRPYSNTEFVKCTFCPGYAVDTTRATVTFTGCTWE